MKGKGESSEKKKIYVQVGLELPKVFHSQKGFETLNELVDTAQ